jgi:hypothetical protein
MTTPVRERLPIFRPSTPFVSVGVARALSAEPLDRALADWKAAPASVRADVQDRTDRVIAFKVVARTSTPTRRV